jgi:hypothetical protein
VIGFSYRTYVSGACLCVTGVTTYGNGVPESTRKKKPVIFHDIYNDIKSDVGRGLS